MKTKHDFSAQALYDTYRVRIKVRNKLCGGMPKNQDVIESWIKASTGFDDEKTKVQTQEALDALVEEKTEKSWNGFPEDEHGIFIWARQLKAMFKESATMLRVTVDKRGSKQIFQHGFEVKALDGCDRIRLGVRKSLAYDEGPIHVQTAQGPRSALKRVDYVEKVEIDFEIWVLTTASGETRHVGEKDIVRMLTFAQENGLGADRSQGQGKFDVVSFERIESE